MKKSKKIKEIEAWTIKLENYKGKEYWSTLIEVIFGDYAALAFAVGAEIFADLIEEPGILYSKEPCNIYMPQLEYFLLNFYLPEQFLDFYSFGFYRDLKCRFTAMLSSPLKVNLEYQIDKILLRVIIDLGSELLEEDPFFSKVYDPSWTDNFLWDDDFLEHVYYSRIWECHPYHFDYWFTRKI